MANYKKIAKISLYSVLGIFILIMLGVVALVTLVNPNHFKPLIEKAAFEATGRKLTLAGNISWTIYPNLGLKIEQFSLSNPAGFKSANLLEVNSADVSVALIPLLSHQIIFKNLAIDGLKIGLVEQNNVNNWTFTPPNPARESSAEMANESPAIHIEFSTLSLTNATVTYDDYDHNKHQGVKNANFKVDTGFAGGVSFDSKKDQIALNKVSFNYNDAAIGALNFTASKLADPSFKGDINITKLMANRLLNDFAIDLGQYKNAQLLDNINFSGKLAGNMQDASVEDFNFNFANNLKGKVTANVKNLNNPSYNGSINLEEFNLNKVLDQAKIAVVERKDKPLLNRFTFNSKFTGTKNSINLKGLTLSAGGLVTLNANLQVQNFARPSFSGDINLPEFSLNKVLDGVNIARADRVGKTLLDSFTFNTKLNGNMNSITLNNYNMKVGKILALSGSAQVQNFANPSFSGNVNLPEFQLNKVLDNLAIAVKERKDKPLLNSFALNTKFSGTKNSMNLNGYNFRFGSVFAGSGNNLQVQNFANPKLNGDINLPVFSVNKVMQQLGMAVPDIPNKERLNKVAVKAIFSGSKTSFNLSQLWLKITDTTITGSTNISSFKPLTIAENIIIDQLDVADFSNINGFKVPLQKIHLEGTSSINNSQLASLNGKQTVQIGNITLLGFSLDEQVHNMDRTISGTNTNGDVLRQIGNVAQINQSVQKVKTELARAVVPGPKDYAKKTNLGSFNSSASFQSGVASPSNFKLIGPSLAINGNGAINLGKKNLNYKVNGQLLVNGINPVFKKVTFPATVQGPFSDPAASLDWQPVITQLIQYAVKNNAQQIKNVVGQQINQAVGGQLNQAIGNNGANQVIDNVSGAAAKAIGNLFGGGK